MQRLTEPLRVATEAAQPAARPDRPRAVVVGVAVTEAEVRRRWPASSSRHWR